VPLLLLLEVLGRINALSHYAHQLWKAIYPLFRLGSSELSLDFETIRTPTTDVLIFNLPAKSIGIEETHGTLEVGKKSNMVILKADPSQNIRNAREIILTIKNGRFYDRSHYNPARFNSIVEEGPEISTDWDKKEKNNNH
jgi:hypothetical protein